MTVKNEILEPYTHADVRAIVVDEALIGWTDGIKNRVTVRVVEIIGVDKLPERVRSWIHNICREYIDPEFKAVFTGKLDEPIDLSTLPNRRK